MTTRTEPTAAAEVTALRARLDVVDAEVRALVARRLELSREIQRVRQSAGGARTDLTREMRVISPYTEAYGRQGTAIAMALLEICRGTGHTAR
ncbi:chorismate mutase [Streptomyces bikiniensis]|uniref:Chorismate mutase n=1 Tax=Streptomyces bikiniensis TaxID=1896 RepID=A0ABW8CLH8_STRBI|nr:chorismate mutase [Streptomyces bikiniensis]